MVVPLDTKHSDIKRMGKICWGGHLEGIDCGDEVAEWLSWNLDRPGLRLVRCTSRTPAANSYGKLISLFSGHVKQNIIILSRNIDN